MSKTTEKAKKQKKTRVFEIYFNLCVDFTIWL